MELPQQRHNNGKERQFHHEFWSGTEKSDLFPVLPRGSQRAARVDNHLEGGSHTSLQPLSPHLIAARATLLLLLPIHLCAMEELF